MWKILFAPLLFASVIDSTITYKADPQWKESLPDYIPANRSKISHSSRLESYSGGSQPGVETYTSQTFLFDELKDQKQKISYESLITSSTVRMPGFPKPMVNRHDFSPYLKGSNLEITWKDREVESIDGLQRLRADLDSRLTDRVMKMGVGQVFGEPVMKSTLSSLHPKNFCAQEMSKKKIAQSWQGQRVTSGNLLKFECTFEGWVKNKEEKLAILKIKIPKQDQLRATGAAADGKIEGEGQMIWHPNSGELFSSIKTKVVLSPTATVSADNRSIVENRVHFVPRK